MFNARVSFSHRCSKLAAAALLAALFTAAQAAAGPLGGKPGTPNSFAHEYKLDDTLKSRARTGGAFTTTRVIVELQAGGTTPPAFAKYSRSGKRLGIINAEVLDVPN